VRPDYPGLQKPTVAATPAVTAQPETTVPAAEQPKVPEVKTPAPSETQPHPAPATQAKLAVANE
jgi:hypothetical protein